jgi:hypothetical protein
MHQVARVVRTRALARSFFLRASCLEHAPPHPFCCVLFRVENNWPLPAKPSTIRTLTASLAIGRSLPETKPSEKSIGVVAGAATGRQLL